MSVSLRFFADPALSAPISSLPITAPADSPAEHVDRVLYVGSLAVSRVFRSASIPGIDPIVVSIATSGTGIATSTIRLASTLAGLAGATPGAPLSLGVEIESGAASAAEVHIRVTADKTVGLYANLSLNVNDLVEIE